MFNERLKHLRERNGQSQKECAESLGVKYANYNKWENGVQPDFETLVKIADYFNATTDYLLGRTEYPYIIPEGRYPTVNSMVAYYEAGLTELANKAVKANAYDVVFDDWFFPDYIDRAVSTAVKRCGVLLDFIDFFKEKDGDDFVFDGIKMWNFLGGDDNVTKSNP